MIILANKQCKNKSSDTKSDEKIIHKCVQVKKWNKMNKNSIKEINNSYIYIYIYIYSSKTRKNIWN